MSARFRGSPTPPQRRSIASSARVVDNCLGLLFRLFTRARRNCSALADSFARSSRRTIYYWMPGSAGVSPRLRVSSFLSTHGIAGEDHHCVDNHLNLTLRQHERCQLSALQQAYSAAIGLQMSRHQRQPISIQVVDPPALALLACSNSKTSPSKDRADRQEEAITCRVYSDS